MLNENLAIARQVTEAQNELDTEKLRLLLAPDFEAHIADWPQPLNREQYIEGVLMSHRAFSNLHFTIEDIFGEGEKVVLRIKATGKHTGDYLGKPATYQHVSFVGMAIRYITNGKVYAEWQINDQFNLLKQLKAEENSNGESPSLPGVFWDRIVNVGRALEKLETVLDHDIFDDLSKHSAKWDSEHEKEADTLYTTRCQLSSIHNQLWDVFGLLKGP